MKTTVKGEVNLIVIFKTIVFISYMALVFLIEIVLLPLYLIILIFYKNKSELLPRISKFIISNGLKIFFILDIKNFREEMKKIKAATGPRIYILNHSSMFDIILLFLLPDNVKTLVKESYTKIPIFGNIIKLNGNIVVKESNGDSQTLSYDTAISELKKNSIIAVFPEGTRSRDGNIGRYKTGAFKMAYETQAEIIPVVMDSWNIVRAGDGFWFRDGKAFAKVMGSYNYSDYKDLDIKAFSKTMKESMASALSEIREYRKATDKKYYRNGEYFRELDKNGGV